MCVELTRQRISLLRTSRPNNNSVTRDPLRNQETERSQCTRRSKIKRNYMSYYWTVPRDSTKLTII